MDIRKKRWLVLIFSCLVALCVGSIYAWSVFASPMAEYLTQITGKKISSLTIVFTVANSVGPITMIAGGYLNDRLGPKLVLLIGGILFGVGMIGSGFAVSLPMLLVTYGLGVGLGVGMIYGTIVSNAVKFFPDKSGLAGGATTACYGGSSILVPLIATKMLENMPITSAFRILGLVMMGVICCSALVIEACPKGAELEKLKNNHHTQASELIASTKEYSYKEMLCTKEFYYMLVLLMCGAFAGMMIISQASPIAQKMMAFDAVKAAGVVSVLAFFNMMGRLMSGMLSDILGALRTLQITFAVSFGASILLYLSNETRSVCFYVGIGCIGFCFGSIMGIYPGYTAKIFGRAHNSVNYGIMFIGFALAGLCGPTLMNIISSSIGRYQPAFLAAAVLAFLGEVIILRLKVK